MEDESIAQDIARCRDCPLLGSTYVPGEGDTSGGVFIVGEAPGDEDRPFVGRSGELLRNVLLGVNLESVYLTNVVKRRPTDDNGEHRKPTRKECYMCGSHLVGEIVKYRPDFVLALGSVAAKFFASRTQSDYDLEIMHGLPRQCKVADVKFILVATYNPGHVARSGGLFSKIGDVWVEDMTEFATRVHRGY